MMILVQMRGLSKLSCGDISSLSRNIRRCIRSQIRPEMDPNPWRRIRRVEADLFGGELPVKVRREGKDRATGEMLNRLTARLSSETEFT
jgi:hypothetical protein